MNNSDSKRIEENLIYFVESITEQINEKYLSGEVNREEFITLCKYLKKWCELSRRLLSVVFR